MILVGGPHDINGEIISWEESPKFFHSSVVVGLLCDAQFPLPIRSLSVMLCVCADRQVITGAAYGPNDELKDTFNYKFTHNYPAVVYN